ncbi:hypothetical protein Tco_0097662 [Tanacetum coccineum]
MSTNARCPTCDIKTNHLTPNEAADTSSEVKILSDMPVTKSVVERKQYIPDKGSEANSEVFLRLDLTETIIVMLGRKWEVSAVIGRYLSTDFVVSDAKGNTIHCYAKATVAHNFLRLKEGSIYYVKKFVVKPNKEEYRILKNDAYMLEFDGSTTIRKASVKADGFVRYLFQLQDFNSIESSDNEYLIYVVGYVTNVGRTNHLKSGSKNIDFHLANHSLPPSTVRSPLMESGQGRDGTSLHVGATPVRRVYWLEVDVSDDTAQVVVVMFNETATALVKCSADSLVDTMDKILPSEGIVDSVGSRNLDDYPDNQLQKLKRIVRDPSIVTPSKPVEERKNLRMDVEDSKSEDNGDSTNGTGKKGAVEPSAKKRKNCCGSGRVGAKGTDATHAAHEKGKGYTHIPFCLDD